MEIDIVMKVICLYLYTCTICVDHLVHYFDYIIESDAWQYSISLERIYIHEERTERLCSVDPNDHSITSVVVLNAILYACKSRTSLDQTKASWYRRQKMMLLFSNFLFLLLT